MPSPVAHLASGWIIFRASRRHLSSTGRGDRSERIGALISITLFSMLPDVDAIPGLLIGDIGWLHNQATHSLLVGVGVALAGAIPLARWLRTSYLRVWLLLLLSYESHVLMDFCMPGRGVMMLWPLSAERFASPVWLFEGFRWGNGLLSLSHVWTISTELLVVAPLLLLTEMVVRRRATPQGLVDDGAGVRAGGRRGRA